MSKIVYIILYIIFYRCYIFIWHLFAFYINEILFVKLMIDKILLKLILFLSIDVLLISFLYFIYLKLKPIYFAFRLFFLFCLIVPIWFELDIFLRYLTFKFDERLICYIHYGLIDTMKIYVPLFLFVAISSCLIAEKINVKKEELVLLSSTIVGYSIMHNIYLLSIENFELNLMFF
ncbi:hypothetical protein C7447_101716 [Tenacibaculum adriaticum]|uniref:Uncharacterized protein n=1 Tax=Tenacibaculum adriaticum TaxID=413713 RepID=A0A5S5DYJ2_9FLAO|nr:hypothetical protein C7447_101716 [Tenacibaculum adriaticum]